MMNRLNYVIFIEDIPLCFMSYKINKMFIGAVKDNNIFIILYYDQHTIGHSTK